MPEPAEIWLVPLRGKTDAAGRGLERRAGAVWTNLRGGSRFVLDGRDDPGDPASMPDGRENHGDDDAGPDEGGDERGGSEIRFERFVH